MRHSLPVTTMRQPLAVWLTLLMALFGAVASSLSHGLLVSRTPSLVAVCASQGPRWSVLPDVSGSPGEEGRATHLEPCPFCLLGQDSLAPLPSAFTPVFAGVGQSVVPVPRQLAWCASQAVRIPPPRGPPIFFVLLNR